MLLREISLKNIRSYNDGSETTIGFPEGIVLFEGDVGSGKSTLLYAVEFALFGTAEVAGAHLLSERRQNGFVKLRFSVDGKDLVVRRGLVKRKDTVAQEECYIELDGRRTALSPADLKERIIDIMHFNEPSGARAESKVFRFAVFTPQEQMKNIIQKDPEDRLEVLRRVLGVSEYQVAANNSETVEQRLKRKAHGLQRASDDLEEKKAYVSALSAEISDLETSIPVLQKLSAEAERALTSLEKKSKELLSRKEETSNTLSKAPELEKRVRMLDRASRDAAEKAERFESTLKEEYLPFIEEFKGKKPPSEKSASALDSELDEKRERREEVAGQVKVLESQLGELNELLSSGTCPRCGQKIDRDFKEKADHVKSEAKEAEKEFQTLDREVKRLTALRKETAGYEEDERKFATLSKAQSRISRDIAESKEEAMESERELKQTKKELEAIKLEENRLKDLVGKIEELEESLHVAREKKESAKATLAQTLALKKAKGESLAREKAEIEKMARMREDAKKLGEYQSWLADYFRPAVGQIERQILMQMNARFNHHFQRLFLAMMDDSDLRVRVNESFSPMLERQGFEQEYDALSGGERTSVALAYRLALNAIVQETHSGVGDLVILDEPTEGFSKEQVYKMRSILSQLGAKQVILVSHETELEAMAQHVFQVTRVNGTSRIRSNPLS